MAQDAHSTAKIASAPPAGRGAEQNPDPSDVPPHAELLMQVQRFYNMLQAVCNGDSEINGAVKDIRRDIHVLLVKACLRC